MGRAFTTVHIDEVDCTLMTFIVWSEEDLQTLQAGLVQDALSKLANSKTKEPLKRQLLKWCLAEDTLPFSFTRCCQIQHIDAFAIQSLLSYRFRKELSHKSVRGQLDAKALD